MYLCALPLYPCLRRATAAQNIEKTLKTHVIGQEEAVKAVSRAVHRASAGVIDPNRPVASFLFSGPTGVGKTELACALAIEFFGSKESLIRLDMSEYMERHSVARLFGSPPGYVGNQNGGQLTEAIRKNRRSVVLLDEIAKAHLQRPPPRSRDWRDPRSGTEGKGYGGELQTGVFEQNRRDCGFQGPGVEAEQIHWRMQFWTGGLQKAAALLCPPSADGRHIVSKQATTAAPLTGCRRLA
ncbi:unnamed protein product [Linum tenue]|uniref:AAA+ ATPase domain-containing protein n=1 Tax=Linum tenue TaxID=586396 RepID=A0AAV0R524_9ROSI|nr:unnamed protein product [Linum tenue]